MLFWYIENLSWELQSLVSTAKLFKHHRLLFACDTDFGPQAIWGNHCCPKLPESPVLSLSPPLNVAALLTLVDSPGWTLQPGWYHLVVGLLYSTCIPFIPCIPRDNRSSRRWWRRIRGPWGCSHLQCSRLRYRWTGNLRGALHCCVLKKSVTWSPPLPPSWDKNLFNNTSV